MFTENPLYVINGFVYTEKMDESILDIKRIKEK